MNVRVDDGPAPMTLVVTVLNVAQDLSTLLSSISRQSTPASEVLIVDRGSTDGTLELLCGWQPPQDLTFKIIELPSACLAAAWNFAIEAASFEQIAVLDGAVELHTEWVSRMSAALLDGAQAAVGQMKPTGATLLERTIACIEAPLPFQIDTRSYSPVGGAIAFTKSSWDLVGGYPEWLEAGEVGVFAIALRQADIGLRLVPDAVASWSPRQNVPEFLAGSFRTARSLGSAGIVDWGLITHGLGYLLGLPTIIIGKKSMLAKLVVVGGLLARFRPCAQRLWANRHEDPDSLTSRAALALTLVIAGDLAKVAGYQRGLVDSMRPADG